MDIGLHGQHGHLAVLHVKVVTDGGPDSATTPCEPVMACHVTEQM
jgi:hypothetical protein